MKLASIGVLLALAASPSAPQQPYVESIEVRVANVDVVVHDKAGNPVVGLTKDDFELYEDGVRQPISNFYEIRRQNSAPEITDSTTTPEPAPAPPELRQRRFVLFVDSTTLQPFSKKPVTVALQKFIENRMQPEDQMMIVTWRFGLQVIAPFTSDRSALARGVETLAHLAPVPDAVRIVKHDIQDYYEQAAQQSRGYSWTQAYKDSILAIDSHSQQLVAQENGLLDALRRTESTVAGLEGKKVLVFVGETLPVKPGAELYRYAYDLFRPHLDGNINIPMEVMTGVMGHDVPSRIEDVAKAASADGVTMYAIGTADTNGEFGADNNIPVDSTEAFSRVANTATSLNTMAEITGGVAITRTTNFDLAFDTIAHDLDSYYSLGYRPRNEVSNAPRKIVVRTKNKAYSVRTRETLVMKSNDEQMSDRVIANLYTEGLPSTWPITLKTGTPQRDGRTYLIPIEVVMPATLTLLPRDGALVGGLVLYAVVGSSDGFTSDVMRRPKGLKIPPNAETAIRAKPMTYSTAIRVKRGENTLSIAILDQISGAMGFARAKVTAR